MSVSYANTHSIKCVNLLRNAFICGIHLKWEDNNSILVTGTLSVTITT